MSSYLNREKHSNSGTVRTEHPSEGNSQTNGPVNGMLFDAYSKNGTNGSHTYTSRSFVSRRSLINANESDNGKGKDLSPVTYSKYNGVDGFTSSKSASGVSHVSGSGSSDNSPLKSLRILLRQFDTGEKRQWPNYLQDLTKLFSTSSFVKVTNEKPGRVIDDVTRVFTRVLTTKLFPDIIQEMVVCLAAFSSTLGYNCRELFTWIFDLYYDSVPDETRLVLLKALVKIIENGGKGLGDNMPALMNKVKRALEEADTCELLLGITDIFLATAKHYSSVLQAHFRDVVDILIGWHIDSSQSPAITQTLAKALISFNFFWVNDLEFSLTLLGQFLEDFEAYFEELMEDEKTVTYQPKNTKSRNGQGAAKLSSDDRLAKMASLVRVYITVLQSLGEYASPDRNTAISWDFIVNSLRSILISVNCTIELKLFESLVIATNECAIFTLELMSGNEQELIHTVSEQLLIYLDSVQSSLSYVNDAYIITTLQLMTRFVRELNGSLPVQFVTSVLSPASDCQKLRFMPSAKILSALYELHHCLLGLKNIPLLEEAYKCFLMDLQIAYSLILSKPVILLPDDIPLNMVSYTEEQAIIAVTSALVSLTEIANAKHSLIGMWALKPTFFDLIIQHSDPSNNILTRRYPNIQYSLIYILYSHSSKHKHFVSSSSLMNVTLTSSSPNVANSITSCSFTAPIIAAPSSGHLSKILVLLASLLKKENLKKNSCVLCLNWAIEILQSSQTNLNHLCATEEMKILMDVIASYAFSKDTVLCLKSCLAFEVILKSVETFPRTELLQECYMACILHMSHTKKEVRDAYVNLFALLPLNCSYASEKSQKAFAAQDFIFPEDIKAAKLALMKREPTSSLSSVNFRTAVAYILENSPNSNTEWLKRLFYTTFSEDNPIKLTPNVSPGKHFTMVSDSSQAHAPSVFDCSENLLVFWCCWELVQYCIVNKLRTPLGKAQDTFTKIEVAIKTNALEAQSIQKSQTKELLQVKMLLLLMELLDKLMYNAYDGCATRLYTTPKLARSFFRTNKTTCVDWMNRNRKSIMISALRSGDPATVWRNGQELLMDMVNKSYHQEVEYVLSMIVNSLIQLGAADVIAGYYVWAKETLSTKYSWIKAAVEEAHGRYENALDEYSNVFGALRENRSHSELSRERPDNFKLSVEEFIKRRMLECYMNLGDWEAAVAWSKDYKSTQGSVFASNVDLSYLRQLSSFDLDGLVNEENEQSLSWDVFSIFHRSQKNLLKAACMVIEDKHFDVTPVQELCENTSALLKTTSMCTPALMNEHLNVLHRNAFMLKTYVEKNERPQVLSPCLADSSSELRKLDCSTLVSALSWVDLMGNVTFTQSPSARESVNALNFVAAKSARKQQNFKLAQNLLLKYAASACGIHIHNSYKSYPSMTDVTQLVTSLNEVTSLGTYSKEQIKFQYEASKLLNSLGDTRTSIDALLRCLRTLNSDGLEKSCQETKAIWSKSLLTLVKYLQSDVKYLEHLHTNQLLDLMSLISECDDEVISSLEAVNHSESIVGKLILLSTRKCSSFGKTCFAMGAWSYKWGRRLIDLEEVDKTTNDKLCEFEEGSYSFYKLAANSYFEFLRLNGTGCEDNNVTATLRLLRLIVKHAPELREILEDGLSRTPTGPWKSIILQLFARLGHPEPYVRQSISDLLCRIGQDSPYLIVFPAVAGSVTNENEDLLFDDEVVQTNADTSNVDVNVLDEDEDYDEEEEKQDTSVMQNCYAALVETLTLQNPELISQTKVFVHELRRITILWDELWIGTLIGHLGEVKKIASNLDEEIMKVQRNATLSKDEKEQLITEKHRIFFRKIVYLLEQTQIITSEAPETPHENWFQRTFSKAISSALKLLKCPNDPSKPQQSLVVYQQLIQFIQKKALQWSSGRSQLVMDTISPVLVSLTNTVIPMPGASLHSGSVVTIEKVYKTVTVLHTKTKPKKIAFHGSDGKLHAYLFKGHEDLHLDERIMQLLTIVNKMLAKHNNKQDKVLFKARNYSVTPLGTKSGLIQWVDGGSALYSFYKRWMLNRDNMVASGSSKGPLKNQPLPNENLYKPSEIFNKKLASKNISSTIRSEWPKSSLVQILQELIEETPGDLISKELWCSATNAYEYWRHTQAFTHSNAVMCMIGYILGLGDRHLDNVLVDLSTGEVIHIDYNICFEKGKTLRVPERVPCRLTQNIVNAFGITGVEGTFRISCEHVIRVLRKGRETLLTLLEAFLYDPLIDWTPGHEEGYTGAIYGGGRISALRGKSIPKQQMEKENAQAMLKIRIAETKSNWLKVKEKLSDYLSSVEEKVMEVEDLKASIENTKREMKYFLEQKCLLEEGLNDENHSLYTLPTRYKEFMKVRGNMTQIEDGISEKIKELKSWAKLHEEALDAICNSQISTWLSNTNREIAHETGPLTVAPVIDFLQSAGQLQLTKDCERAETDLISSMQHCRMIIVASLEALGNYAKIVQHFPPSYRVSSRNRKLCTWLEELQSNLSEAKCEEILRAFQVTYRLTPAYTDANFNAQPFRTIFSFLKSSIEHVNTKVQKTAELQQAENSEEAQVKQLYSDVCGKLEAQIKQDDVQSQISVAHAFVGLSINLTKRMLQWEKSCQTDLMWVLCHYPPNARDDESADCVWLLNEMELLIAEFVGIQQTVERCCPEIKQPISRQAFKAVKAAHSVYTALVELNFNFQSIILPETLKLLQAKNPSAIEAIGNLEVLINSLGGIQIIETMIKNLENGSTSVSDISEIILNLRQGFETILNTDVSADSAEQIQVSKLSSGQMLLIGFSGIFTKVDDELEALLVALEKWTNTKEWSNVDLISDAKSLMKNAENVQVLCFLEQLKVMCQVFGMCVQQAQFLDFQNEAAYLNAELVNTHTQMIESIQFYIGKYLQKKLAGLASMTMGYAVCEMLKSLKVNVAREVAVGNKSLELIASEALMMLSGDVSTSNVSPTAQTWEDAWQKQHRWKQYHRLIMMHKVSLDVVKINLVQRQWWHEDLIQELQSYPYPGTEHLLTLIKPTRLSVMGELRKAIQSLQSSRSAVVSSQERYSSYTSSIVQRLKWATGANQALIPYFEQLETLIAKRSEKCGSLLAVQQKIVRIAEGVINFEALHTKSPETLALENSFVALVNRCLKACAQAEKTKINVSPVEEKLVKMMALPNRPEYDFVVSEVWMLTAIEKNRHVLTTECDSIDIKNANLSVLWASFLEKITALKGVIASHNTLLSEIKHLIRTLTKLEEKELGADNKLNGPVNQYYLCHRKFIENLFKLLKELEGATVGSDETNTLVDTLKNRLKSIRSLIPLIYDELLNLDGILHTNSSYGEKELFQKPLLKEVFDASFAAPEGRSSSQTVEKAPKQYPGMERNTYATNVWKRVKMKLDGRDPDGSKRSTISEQVDYVIKESVDIENLALMYEGWTSWV